jgi:hypothetical protein
VRNTFEVVRCTFLIIDGNNIQCGQEITITLLNVLCVLCIRWICMCTAMFCVTCTEAFVAQCLSMTMPQLCATHPCHSGAQPLVLS